jgi:hypothetical protein
LEIDAVGFSIFKQIGAALALGFLGHSILVEGGFVPTEDVDAQRVVGRIFALCARCRGDDDERQK